MNVGKILRGTAATHGWQEMRFILDVRVEFNGLIIEPPVGGMGTGYGKKEINKYSCGMGERVV